MAGIQDKGPSLQVCRFAARMINLPNKTAAAQTNLQNGAIAMAAISVITGAANGTLKLDTASKHEEAFKQLRLLIENDTYNKEYLNPAFDKHVPTWATKEFLLAKNLQGASMKYFVSITYFIPYQV